MSSNSSFYITKGFASLNYDDTIARSTYIEQLPMIAECLSFDHFVNELETVLKSISQFSNMVLKFTEVFPSVLEKLTKDDSYKVIYLAGDKICISAEDVSKKAFLSAAEKYLVTQNDIQHEFNDFLKPQLLSQISDYSLNGRFALWRLARLTILSADYSQYEDLFFRIFAGNDSSISNASEALCVMHPVLAKKYLIKALMSPNDQTRIHGVNCIEALNIDTTDQFISMAFENESSNQVLQRIVKLPSKMLSEAMMKKLISNSSTASAASSVALSSPYFQALLPALKEKGGIGCEINCVDFSLVRGCNPVPYDFLSMLLKESKEFIRDETIEALLTLDENQIVVKLLFPRMNERGNWRARFNAIKIVNKVLERAKQGKKKLDQNQIMNFAGFVVAMGLDNVYSVRKSAFELLMLFPPTDAVFVIDSLISIVSTTDDFQKQVLREFLIEGRPIIATSYDRKKIENVMKTIDMDYPNYFNVK